MGTRGWTFLFVGLTFALYLAIAENAGLAAFWFEPNLLLSLPEVDNG